MSRAKRLTGKNVLSYIGVRALSPFNFTIQRRPPTIYDYAEFNVGDIWLDEITNTPPIDKDIWVLVKKIGGIATWVDLEASLLDTLTGNTGGVVGAGANENINILGDKGFYVTGTPLNNTLTIEAVQGNFLQSLTDDVGAIVYADANQNINILGTAGVLSVTGTPGTNTLTLDIDAAITSAKSYVTDTDTAVPAVHILNVLGSLGSVINTSASGNNLYVNLTNGTAGQVLIGGGAAATWDNVTVTGQIEKTEGANSLNLEVIPLARQIGFSASNLIGHSNITGDGTVYQCVPEHELFDHGGIYNHLTGIFTAPRSGYYYIGSQIFFKPNFARTGGTECYMEMVSSGNVYRGRNLPTHAKINGFWGPNTNITYTLDMLVYMTALDTAFVRITSVGGARTDSIQTPIIGGQGTMTFYGYLYFE